MKYGDITFIEKEVFATKNFHDQNTILKLQIPLT